MIKDKQIQVNFSLFKLLERLIFIILLIIIGILYFNKRADFKEQINLNLAATDSLDTYINRYDEKVAKIRVIETDRAKDLLRYETTDKTLRNLQTLVKRNAKLLKKQGSASIVKLETEIDTTATTTVTTDELNSPIYTSSVETKWYEISSIADKNFTSYKLKTFHNLKLTIGREKQGLFKPSIPYALATDENPNSNITEMRTYQVTLPPSKQFGLGLHVGYGVSKDGLGPVLSAGINYNPIKF